MLRSLATTASVMALAVVGGSLGAEDAPAAAPTAADAIKSAADAVFTTHNLWMMLATGLVFIMHLGFGCVESGLCQSKNATNILFKNTLVPCIGLLVYAAWGFNLMYPGFGPGEGVLKFAGFGLTPPENGMTDSYAASKGYTYWTDFLFQGMFAATAATIVSGAVAERVKFVSFMLFTLLFVGITYPWLGSWKWGMGWLHQMGFYDFAGSTLVHSIGGWGALAGVIVLGPRLGKYVNGRVKPILGHSMPLATIGCFLLWLGWFGFNGGSVLSANPALVSLVLVTTCLAAAAGGVAAAVVSAVVGKKPDLSMTLNGILAGLVGITAGADSVTPLAAIAIGLIAGAVVYFAVLMFDRLRLDDPVGALSVHLVCGIWGTLAVGIFGNFAGSTATPVGDKTGGFLVQLLGVAAIGAAAFAMAMVFWYAIKLTIGVRVDETEETEGLDAHEHGIPAYHLPEQATARGDLATASA